jgi:Ribose 5-phosphate isomerase A (phosphoriboisomerase A)
MMIRKRETYRQATTRMLQCLSQTSKISRQIKMRFVAVAVFGAVSISAFTSLGPTRTRAFSRSALNMALSQDELKKQVGYKAVDDYVKSGMVVGLGTGSTAYYAVERVGQLLKSGELKDIVAIPTSVRTKEQAESLGIPLVTLDSYSKLDVAIDGADEVDPDLNLVKGGGGALLREKMVEIVSDKFIVIGK